MVLDSWRREKERHVYAYYKAVAYVHSQRSKVADCAYHHKRRSEVAVCKKAEAVVEKCAWLLVARAARVKMRRSIWRK